MSWNLALLRRPCASFCRRAELWVSLVVTQTVIYRLKTASRIVPVMGIGFNSPPSYGVNWFVERSQTTMNSENADKLIVVRFGSVKTLRQRQLFFVGRTITRATSSDQSDWWRTGRLAEWHQDEWLGFEYHYWGHQIAGSNRWEGKDPPCVSLDRSRRV